MKKIIFYFCCILMLMCVFLSGCDKPIIQSEAVVMLIGNHANSKMINWDKIKEEVKDVYINLGTMSFIVVDGNPEIIYKDDAMLGYVGQDEMEKRADEKRKNGHLWETKMETIFEDVGYEAYYTMANDDEVDLLKALDEAESALNYSLIEGVKYDKRIIIYDSGLSTTGVVNFCERDILRMSEKEIDAFVDELYNNKDIPTLNEVEVEWYGIGEVVQPQQSMANKYCEKIKYLWKSIIEKVGGSVEFVDCDFNETVNVDCKVSTVKIPSVSKEIFTIYFEGDSTNYNNNEVIAENVLKQAAEEIKASDGMWYVIGCEATRTEDGVESLKNHYSALRADKIARELRMLGVSDSQITISALGPYDPWNVDEYEGENWKNELASKNRKVVIIHTENPKIINYIEFIEEGKIG